MNGRELELYESLGKVMEKVTDPKYHPHPAKCERVLEQWVRENWDSRQYFPSWVLKDYIPKWIAQKRSQPESQSAKLLPNPS